MEKRRWEVVAVYVPGPVKTHTYDHKGKWTGFTVETIPSSRAGLEFKFTVVNVADEVEAVAAVMQSGFFLSGLSKQFGFVAKEMA